MKHTFNDPIGPGTPAWAAFDRAKQSTGRAYHNRRQYMIQLLREAGASHREIQGWCKALKKGAGGETTSPEKP